MSSFLVGTTRQYEMFSGLLGFASVLRISIISTLYLILANMLNWSHNGWNSILLIFILSVVVLLLQHFLAQLLAKLFGVSLIVEKGSRVRQLIRLALEIVLMLILNFALLAFGSFDVDKQMLRPLVALNVFLLFFPMVNAVFDYASFSFTRIFLRKYTSPNNKKSWIEMAKYFLLDLLAASLCLILLTVCTALGLERVQSFVFAICCGLSGRGYLGDTFHTGIESKGCQSAVAVHYDFLHFRAHSPACYIVSHTACRKNLPELVAFS